MTRPSNHRTAISRRHAVASGLVAAGAAGTGLAVVLGTAAARQSTSTPDAVGAATPVNAASPAASPVTLPAPGSPVVMPVAPPIVRRDATTLTAAEKAAFTGAVVALKSQSSPWGDDISTYDQFVLWHREAFDCDLMAAHMGPAFFPWHRMYLNLFERQLQTIDPDVTLPYWDWTVDTTTDGPIWQPDLMGGTGDPERDFAVADGPFRRGAFEVSIFDHTDDERLPFLIRDIGVGELAPDLPTAAQVEAGLAMPTYDAAPWDETADPTVSFRNYMEGWRDCEGDSCAADPGGHPKCHGDHLMHNRVHLWVSGEFTFAHQGGHEDTVGPYGTMAMNSSPNDPVFFLHHANLDRLWSQWIQRHGQVYIPESGAMHGHNLNDPMWPFHTIGFEVTPADMLDTRAMGYVYDTD